LLRKEGYQKKEACKLRHQGRKGGRREGGKEGRREGKKEEGRKDKYEGYKG
jgi:hypothetical protein